MKKWIAKLLALALLMTMPALQGSAAEPFAVTAVLSADGQTLKISASGTEPVRGLQVDIENIDPGILEIRSSKSLIGAPDAQINEVNHLEKWQTLRLLCLKEQGTLAEMPGDLMEVVFSVRPDVADSGTLVLPVTLKVQTEQHQYTVSTSCTISYGKPAKPLETIEISWGSMDFTYDSGTWNPYTHDYENGAWNDGGTGFVTIRNHSAGSAEVQLSYSPLRKEISGSLSGTTLSIPGGGEEKITLTLQGKPETSISYARVGTVTVRIGGE